MAAAEFVVSFREFFEIAAVLAIILAYLGKTGRAKLSRYVWGGAGAAGVASVLLSYAFENLMGGFWQYEALFEGAALLAATLFVSWLIVWMMAQQNVEQRMRRGIDLSIGSGGWAALFAFAFFAVLREGVEIVLFLSGIRIAQGGVELLWVAGGAACAFFLAWAAFSQLVKLDLERFFKVTGMLLVLMAGGLAGQAMHEFEEAGLIPQTITHVYDINPPQNQDGGYPPLHEKGFVGGALKSLFGFDFDPSLVQIIAQFGYYAIALAAYSWLAGRHNN